LHLNQELLHLNQELLHLDQELLHLNRELLHLNQGLSVAVALKWAAVVTQLNAFSSSQMTLIRANSSRFWERIQNGFRAKYTATPHVPIPCKQGNYS
jgi:hypothetical protein